MAFGIDAKSIENKVMAQVERLLTEIKTSRIVNERVLAEQKETNAKLDEIVRLLQKGE